MPLNFGKEKEMEMVAHLNNKKTCEISNNLRSLLSALYGPLEDDEVVSCKLIDDFIKPDFVITYDGQSKYISMKTGRAEVLHQETISTFIKFLDNQGISKETQETILLYQYGDGTTDGTGKTRIDYNELRVLLKDRITKANIELNESKDFVLKVIERCILLGTLENAIRIDGLYFGNYKFGEIATTKQIIKHIKRKDWDWMRNLHIGPIQLRPHARYIGKEIKNPESRNKLECYWANLSSDIDYISNRYDF